ncbi:MAG: transglycosylase SLT domain-containing protein [Acidobacteria bacterium]|nr:transglycosylase SLT domain-containing protein [Acidobacteriota bacterium]
MRLLLPVLTAAAFVVPAGSANAIAQTVPAMVATGSAPATDERFETPSPISEAPDIPENFRELVRRAQKCYSEGSEYIKAGESAKARARFNDAVDILLESGWDLSSSPVLHRFFQDLLQQIHQDESRYLQPQAGAEEKQEEAVVDELERLDLIPISVDPALEHLVEADIAASRYDIPIVLNEAVLKALNYWLGKGRPYFVDGIKRSGRYRELIENVFQAESIPLDLLYLAQVESLFKTNAVSRARARGIWQFGRWTAIRYGLKVNRHIDERSDPEKSTWAAARYLNELYSIFRDWTLVLAAYNCGEGKVQRLIERTGRNDFWDLLELRRNFPRETRNHVPLIMASIILARHPEKYGLPLETDPPIAFDRVPISKPTDLRAISKLLGTSLQQLRELNPALRSQTTPPGYPDFELRIPAGTSPEVYAQLAALPEVKIRPEPIYGDRYRVRPGDTLSGIAARLGISIAALQEENGITSPRSLRAGTWLSVPQARTRTSSARQSKSLVSPGAASPRLSSSARKTGVPKTSSVRPSSPPSSNPPFAGSSREAPSQ